MDVVIAPEPLDALTLGGGNQDRHGLRPEPFQTRNEVQPAHPRKVQVHQRISRGAAVVHMLQCLLGRPERLGPIATGIQKHGERLARDLFVLDDQDRRCVTRIILMAN